jgi:hypothetical protein
MPKLNGRDPKVPQGETNPRHFIMIPVGTGNRYCRNCKYLESVYPVETYCRVFDVDLSKSARFGPERCPQCRDAEKLIQITKEVAQKQGEDAAFFKAQGVAECRRASDLSMMMMGQR